jgi:uncharacterized protein (DUF1015 family)
MVFFECRNQLLIGFLRKRLYKGAIMTKIRAFKALRPAEALAARIASRPYDVLSSEEARVERQGNDQSFYRIIKPEVDLANDVDSHSQEAYDQAAKNLQEFISKEWLVEDKEAYLYFYRQRMGEIDQTGLVCVSAIDDYFDDHIKKHEFTRPAKEEDRIAHMGTIGAHPGPVFLSHPSHARLRKIRSEWQANHEPVFSFDAGDGVLHEGWILDDPSLISDVQEIFEQEIPKTYIADGHHRSAASAKVGLRLREADTNSTGQEPYNFFLSVIFDEDDLAIWDYNRVIKDLNGRSSEEFLTEIGKFFEIKPSESAYKPSAAYDYGLYLESQWYQLSAKARPEANDPVRSLDVSVLSERVLAPLLGIEDQRTSERIDFVGGIRGVEELQRRVDSGDWQLAFSIFPVSMKQLMAVAEAGEVMPPKSTWFEPKLRSGLFAHRFKS